MIKIKKISYLLYIFGILSILSILVIKNVFVGISLIIIGFISIIISTILPYLYFPIGVPDPTQKPLDDLFDKIQRLIKPSPTEISRLRGPVGELCSTTNEWGLSEETGVDKRVIKSYFEAIKKNTDLEQKLGKNYEIVTGRENDVGLVGAIYLALKGAIENLKARNEVKGKILDIIEKYSERNSVNNFVRCKESLIDLKNTLKILVEEKNPFEFGVSIVQKRLRIPHYESTIFAFEMVRYMLDQNEIKPSIDKSTAKEILYDDLELLITELKLRNIILDTLRDIAESFVQDKIDKKNALDQIRDVLELYVNSLDVTRSRFSATGGAF